MWKRLRQFFIGGLDDSIDLLLDDVSDLKEILANVKLTDNEAVVALMRHQLGSIDLNDVVEDKMTPEERLEYLGKVASIIYPNIKNKAEKFIRHQERFMAVYADINDQMWFAKGSINGLKLLMEDYEKENQEFVELSKPKEKFDPHKLIESL